MTSNQFKTPTRGEIFQSMVSNYEKYYVEGDTKITDLSEGSEIGTLLNSICVELEALYLHDALLCDQKFVKTATGNYLDLLACEHHLTREQGTYATTYCTFSIVGDLQTTDIVIPSGTRIIHRNNGNIYTLQNNLTIIAASRTVTGRVVALYPGEEYNADVNTLTAFESVSTYSNKISVTNYTPVTGGTDTETDESLRQRILASNKDRLFGSLGWYKTQLQQRDGIHDVNFVNPRTADITHQRLDRNNEISDCTSCTRVCYVNIDDNSLSGETDSERQFQIDQVLFNTTTWLENQNNLVVGHNFHCQQAEEEKFYLEIVAYDTSAPSEAEILEVLHAYIRGGSFEQGGVTYTYPGINIGGTLNRGSIMAALERITSIQQVEQVNRLRHNQNKKTEAHGNWKYVGEVTGRRDNMTHSLYEHTDMYGFVFQAMDLEKEKYEENGDSYYDVWGRLPFPTQTLNVDTCAILGDVASKNKEYNVGEQISTTEEEKGIKWYENWYWYDDNYSTIIYRSLGSSDVDGNYDSSTFSIRAPTDTQTE